MLQPAKYRAGILLFMCVPLLVSGFEQDAASTADSGTEIAIEPPVTLVTPIPKPEEDESTTEKDGDDKQTDEKQKS